MPKGLRRFHASGDRHFITCSCYRRQQFLGSARRRDLFLKILDEVRQQYDFVVWGYVVMPEHFHLLIGEPSKRNIALVMQVLKQRVSGPVPPKEEISQPDDALGRSASRFLAATIL
jgi:putative transposase